jgi:hypothetical protein
MTFLNKKMEKHNLNHIKEAEEKVEFRVLLMNTFPTKNGRSYSKEVLESMAYQINHSQLINIGIIGVDDFQMGTTPLSKAAFYYSNAEIEGESLYVKISGMEEFPEGRKLKNMLFNEDGNPNSSFSFRPAGTGTINESEGKFLIGEDYKINTITVIPSQDDALNYE